MHVQLSNGKLLNLMVLEDAKQGFHDKKVAVIYLTNGTKFIENFATEAEAQEEVELIREAAKAGGGLVQKDTFNDFPEKGNPGTIYIAKDTGQTYYWDKVTNEYVTTGTAGRTGVYSVDKELPETVGKEIKIKKTDLVEILKPTVEYSDGSEIIGNNSVHGIITSSTDTEVTVKTITDLVIDSFRQVATIKDLPKEGVENVLYYVQEIDEFRIWDVKEKKWVEPFHPIIFKEVEVKNARLNTLYIQGDRIVYTTDNKNWIYLNTQSKEYLRNKKYYKDDLVYFDGELARVVKDYTSDNTTDKTVKESFELDITNNKLVNLSRGAKLEKDITSNTDCGAAPKGSFFNEGMTFTEFAEKILRKEITPAISCSFSGTGVKRVGTFVDSSLLKLTITNLADVTTSIEKVEFYVDGNLVNSQPFVKGKSVYQYNYTASITSGIPDTITAKAVLTYDTSLTKQGTGSFTFVYPSYAIVTNLATITDADATTLASANSSSAMSKTSNGHSWSGVNLNDERFCYMYPQSLGPLSSIIDGNGFSQMDSYTQLTVNITDSITGNSVPYFVYLLTDPTTGTGFVQRYD